MKALVPDLSKRKSILSNLCKKNHKYKILIAISWLLRVCACLILTAGLIYIFLNFEMQALILIPLSVVAFAIPFVCGTSMKNIAKYKYAYPLSGYANGTLLLGESSLEYVYWRISRHEAAAYSSKHAVYRNEDKFVYSIAKENIDTMTFDDGLCRVHGAATIKLPEWAQDTQKGKKGEQSVSEFEFVLAFKESDIENIIENWRI